VELSFKAYDTKECAASSHKIAKLVKEKICNTFDLLGCKVICLCYITKRAKPSLAIDSGCAWDQLTSTVEKDAFVDYVYKNQTIVAVASLFVIYCQRFCSKKMGQDLLQCPIHRCLRQEALQSLSQQERGRIVEFSCLCRREMNGCAKQNNLKVEKMLNFIVQYTEKVIKTEKHWF